MPAGHVDRTRPLRPLSAFALDELERIATSTVAPYKVNPGVRDRLLRGGLIVYCERLGARWLEATADGRLVLAGRR